MTVSQLYARALTSYSVNRRTRKGKVWLSVRESDLSFAQVEDLLEPFAERRLKLRLFVF